MKLLRGTIGLLALSALGCTAVAGPPLPSEGPRYRLLAVAPAVAVDADSQLSTNPAAYGADGQSSTAWTNGGYRNATAWLRLRFGADEAIASIAIKMPPAATGTSYDVQVSTDGSTWTTALANQKNTTWNLETKVLPAGTHGRYLRVFWRNSATTPQPHVSIYELSANRSGTVSSPSPSPSASATPTPLPSSTTSPGASPPPANPGPYAATGIVLNNGAPVSGITIQVGGRKLTTDSRGVYRVTGLAAGTYQAYYYNPTDRNKIGYWRSRPMTVDGTRGASFATVDLYLRGMMNIPAPGATVTLPTTFQWLAPIQPVRYFFYRIHSQPYTSFQLVYQSPRLEGTVRSYTWNGGTTALDPSHRYFWGVKWDWGDLGEGGNLYQPVYLRKP